MFHILSHLIKQFRQWDAAAKTGFLLAIGLLLPFALIARNGPEDLRLPATGTVIALVIVAQGIFMWANRGMVTPFSRAQKMYLNEDFEAAINLLETLRESGDIDYRVLTLLGNAYRQIGRLSESETVLYEAVNISADHYFPHYGFGRTLLTKGRYPEAIEYLRLSLKYGAPSGVRFDLGEALYRADDIAGAREQFDLLDDIESLEHYRQLMAAFVLYASDQGMVPREEIIRSGLPYWENAAHIYAHTPYGASVARDVESISALIGEG